jgi:CheY-like chemotaxis protein
MKGLLSEPLTSELLTEVTPLIETGILVIDEDPAFQLGLKTFLKEYVGFEHVFTARNGKEAIDLINREPSIELLTVDYQMPVMDGMRMLTQLQANTPRHLGVTMITGFPSEQLKKEFAARKSPKLLANHFLPKPVEFEKLEPIILESYEELNRSKIKALKAKREEPSPADGMGGVASHRELLSKLDYLSEKLEAQTQLLQKLQHATASTFFLDILKLLLTAGILYFIWQSGWLKTVGDKLRLEPQSKSGPQMVPFVKAIKLPLAPASSPESGNPEISRTPPLESATEVD